MAAPTLQPAAVDAPARRPTAQRLRAVLPQDRLAGWLGPLLVTALAAFLRFDGLASPRGRIFDEVYYAQDAHDQLVYGVPVDPVTHLGRFVVHPPLGKWFIAAGEWLFGVTTQQALPIGAGQHGITGGEFGYRFASAVIGTIAVLLLARIARRMTGSTLLGCVAGLLLAVDGLSLVQSRLAMLDIFLMFWVLAAFGCLVVDRDRFRARLAAAVEAGGTAVLDRAGPRLGVRWWRLAGGVCIGAACATKWDGAYYLVVFGFLALLWDWGARRTAGARRALRQTLRRELLPMVAVFVVVPVGVYLASYIGWFASSVGWDRNWAATHASTVPLVPDALRSLWHYQWEIWHFHTTLEAHHPYQSHPSGWLLLARPVLYYFTQPACAAPNNCVRDVLGIGLPAIWWAGDAALVAMAWRSLARRDWRASAILLTVAVTILAWVPSDLHHRTMFLFYALPALPFLCLALAMAAGMALGPPTASSLRRLCGAVAVGGYLLIVLANFFGLPFAAWAGFYPILTGHEIAYADWLDKMWISSWI